MNWELLISLAAVGMAFPGWIFVHKLNAQRDRMNKDRDLRLQYLIDAYRKLESGAGCDLSCHIDRARGWEEAVADIQLFGTQEQIQRLKVAFQSKKETGEGSLIEVLKLLRNDLRRELNLPELQDEPTWLRIETTETKRT